jgi:multiple sugar transport system substrate-binding protein
MSDERVSELIAEATRLRYSRRGIVKRAAALGLSGAALNSVLVATGRAAPARRAPAVQLGGSLSILAGSYFVPEAQEFFDQQVRDWGSQNGVEITTDYINWPDIQARVASAVEGGSGPDVVEMRSPWPYLYYENMVPMDDVAAERSEQFGGYYEWVTGTASVDGKWYSIPVGSSSAAYAYRISYLEQAGIADPKANFPKTWEELFALGAELKAAGKPIGQGFGHSPGDPVAFAYPYMWAHGAMEVEEDGETVAFNTPEFVAGMEALIQAWTDAFDETGLSWDDSTNNRAFLSDQLGATINGSSIYIAAQNAKAGASTTDFEVVVDPADIWHAPLPAGPAGQFVELGSWSYAAMSYSENQEAAVELLKWWTGPEPFQAWLEAQKGYIIPPGPGLAELEVYTADPALAPYVQVAEIARHKGYAGPSNQKAAQVGAQYIVVDAFANAIQNGDAGQAIEQAARQLERIYGR